MPFGITEHELNEKLRQKINDVSGEITPDHSESPASPGTGTMKKLFGWITNRIKAITGKTNWWDTPATTLEVAGTHISAEAPHAGHETPTGAQNKVNAAITSHNNAADPHTQYALGTQLDAHVGDSVKHVTAAERSTWNNKANKSDIPTSLPANGGSAETATKFASGRLSYKGVTDDSVAGQLMWKNYGNGHTIFDASHGTTPTGGACDRTNAQVAWQAGLPTLMGYNGENTFGVRVDRAKEADTVNGRYAWEFMNAITPADGYGSDPNTTTESLILSSHANTPNNSIYWFIHTFFYSSRASNRAQIAISYNGSVPMMYIRQCYSSWTPWKKVFTGSVTVTTAGPTGTPADGDLHFQY